MRLLIDTLVAFMLAGILGGVVYFSRQSTQFDADRELARRELHRFQQQINLHDALAGTDPAGSNITIDPVWFQGKLPINPFLGSDHPWVEIAAESERALEHPKNLAAANENVAAFWFNPYRGILRARVPVGVSDQQTLELYNAINGCSLTSLFNN